MSTLQGTGRLEGVRVIITAAASGMGRAGCELFAREGARVAAIDRDVAGLQDLTKSIEDRGGNVKAISADLLDERQAAECIQSAKSWLGGIDALWSHAGMPAPAARMRSENVPCGTRSSCTVPLRTISSRSLFSPT